MRARKRSSQSMVQFLKFGLGVIDPKNRLPFSWKLCKTLILCLRETQAVYFNLLAWKWRHCFMCGDGLLLIFHIAALTTLDGEQAKRGIMIWHKMTAWNHAYLHTALAWTKMHKGVICKGWCCPQSMRPTTGRTMSGTLTTPHRPRGCTSALFSHKLSLYFFVL